MTGSLTERYDDRISGVLSCYDRVVVTGTLPTVCYAEGMTRFLSAENQARRSQWTASWVQKSRQLSSTFRENCLMHRLVFCQNLRLKPSCQEAGSHSA